MKDLVIVFLLALAIGSALNNYQWGPDPGDESAPPVEQSGSTSAEPSGPSSVTNISDANFEQEVLKSETPVLVDFWAPWCAPCRAMGPTIEALSRQNVGRVKVVKVNVDDNPVTSNNYQINTLPAFYVFKGGQVAERILGAGEGSKRELAAAIEKVGGGAGSTTAPGAGSPATTESTSPKMDVFQYAPQPGNNAVNGSIAPLSTQAAPLSSALSENADVPMLDETGFDRDVIKSASPVLVFFCDASEPCDRIWPTVQTVANKVMDNYRVVRVNIGAHPALAQQYFVHATPTFVIFRDGRRTKQLSGVLPEKALLSFLELGNRSASADTRGGATN